MYTDLEATLHDLFWAEEGGDSELELLDVFLRDCPGTVLELGCGSGRLLLPLRERGYLIEGLDISEEMLDLCRKKDDDVVLHHSGMEDFETGTLYGAIIIPAFSLQLLPFEKIPEVLECVRKHLQPEGKLYFTTFVPWAEIAGELDQGEWFVDHEIVLGNGNTAKCSTCFEMKRLTQQLLREHKYKIISPQGKVLDSTETQHSLTWFWPRELTMLLHHAGFSVEEIVTDFDPSTSFDNDGQILTVIASLLE